MLRYAGLLAGLLVAWHGGVLATEEAGLVGVRHAARDGRPQRLAASTARLEAAYAAVSDAGLTRDDLAAVALDLALELDGRAAADGAPQDAGSRERIRRSAHALVRVSPMNANGWCVLALATAKAHGVAGRAADQLRACYDYGPQEIGVFGGRLALALAAWDELPLNLRTAAMIDVAVGLRDPTHRRRMAEQLAWTVTSAAPERAGLAQSMVDHYGDQLKTTYAQALARFRREAEKRSRNR